MKFDFCIGNPPYQEETAKKETTNGQKRRKSIFHYFQVAADQITKDTTVLIYPGIRWLHQSGKGMQEFGKTQINDVKLSRIEFYPNSRELFPNADIPDGITIVVKQMKKIENGFNYYYKNNSKCTVPVKMNNPGDRLINLDPQSDIVGTKIEQFATEYQLDYLNKHILSQKLFGVESDFVEKNSDKVKEYTEGMPMGEDDIKLFANDKSGSAGRAKWYVTHKNNITQNKQYIYEWKVVVSSAHGGGQDGRNNQLSIIDNQSAFGRSRVALRSFKTKEEAENFFKYCQSYIVRYAFLLTDEALTSLGKKVPDLIDYTNNNKLIDFSRNIDAQLKEKMEISDTEFLFIKDTVDNIRKKD